jgi:hypothetical protein
VASLIRDDGAMWVEGESVAIHASIVGVPAPASG